jgi:hypothetical protein
MHQSYQIIRDQAEPASLLQLVHCKDNSEFKIIFDLVYKKFMS